jgi:NAD(P)-dependent dehydrogenase (short-subunit alcohol dehydrogenase family)
MGVGRQLLGQLQRDQVPEDVCGAVVFALSSLSRFVTGQLIAVNGGFVMH